MEKEVLIQYCEMVEEIKDLRNRIAKIEKELKKLESSQVSDTVKGTRKDGTYGPIKVTGVPLPGCDKKRMTLKKNKALLEAKEIELLELTCQAEEYIESLEKSEMRSMLRFSIIDGMTNLKVAQAMNRMFPGRSIKYTDENVKKRIQRFFENVSQCPEEIC